MDTFFAGRRALLDTEALKPRASGDWRVEGYPWPWSYQLQPRVRSASPDRCEASLRKARGFVTGRSSASPLAPWPLTGAIEDWSRLAQSLAMVPPPRIERGTSRATIWRSNQLS